jgi:hypothetical protein
MGFSGAVAYFRRITVRCQSVRVSLSCSTLVVPEHAVVFFALDFRTVRTPFRQANGTLGDSGRHVGW